MINNTLFRTVVFHFRAPFMVLSDMYVLALQLVQRAWNLFETRGPCNSRADRAEERQRTPRDAQATTAHGAQHAGEGHLWRRERKH